MIASVASLRAQIETIDEQLVSLIAKRLALAKAIGERKRERGIPVTDPAREAAVVARVSALARDAGVPEDEMRALCWRLLAMSRRVQLDSAPGPVVQD